MLSEISKLPHHKQMETWKQRFAQHCFSHHLTDGGCARFDSCAFVHIDAQVAEQAKGTDSKWKDNDDVMG